ncbi:MAG: glycine--tRNA ligase subunit beta [Candidatus Latescibacteria bacterium]|nr:glycine--tRNA ligase subunit beta [Candidatus Latescibacterota bacterium]
MSNKLNFQDIIMRLERFWADRGCIIWQPYSEKVGAGTMNAATVLRVLGPEAWNVAYVEPSYRPDDGRFGENPNRMQMHTQYQVILKPDPGNPQELYLDSLEALGLDRKQHDIRFVEDNWESPALGAWGLGWEVWLDGMEITQFTYFQQAGGMPIDPVAVEITYGLERIAMYLQEVNEVWQLQWNDTVTYGDILKKQEIEYCNYEFYWADVDRLKTMYEIFVAEAKSALDRELVIPAHDYVIRCSHTFNLLDTRGAIGVTERARFFAEMRDLSRQVAETFAQQREDEGHPLAVALPPVEALENKADDLPIVDAADLLLEIGTEELPPADVVRALGQLEKAVPERLNDARLTFDSVKVSGTPRRLFVEVKNLLGSQPDETKQARGPAIRVAFDDDGNPTKALQGFCRGQGVDPADVEQRDDYVWATVTTLGQKAQTVLSDLLPEMIGKLNFGKTMRWHSDGVAFPRPLRWLVALFGDQVIPFTYARATSGRISRGLRPDKSPEIELASASDYQAQMEKADILVDREKRRETIWTMVSEKASELGGVVKDDPDLLDEVTDLVEAPHALGGAFDEKHLALPSEVLISVMKKHQRYFPVFDTDGKLMPCFITVSNGKPSDPDLVVRGNEGVVRARYADAEFFFKDDTQKKLEDFLSRLDTLTFQEKLGSMRDKSLRVEKLVADLADDLGLAGEDLETSVRAATLCKADLATSMVVEMTSLQGVIGRYYALASGESDAVATAIEGHYHPRFPGDSIPDTLPGLAVSVADRLDSLAGLFGVGIKPRSMSDPYGLRRDALGLLANLVGQGVHFSLRRGLQAAAQHLPVKADDDALDEALEYVIRRFEVNLRDEGLRHDAISAAIAAGLDDPYEIRRIAEAFTEQIGTDAWLDVLHAHSRCKRIVRNLDEEYELNSSVDPEPSSKVLFDATEAAWQKMDTAKDKLTTLLEVMADLQEPINVFFEAVLVMAKEPELKASRLALVQRIAALPDDIVDLSQFEGF